VLVSVLCLVAAAGGGDGGGQSEGGVTKVTYLLPFDRSIAFWPIHLAEELGYFKEEGLEVSSEPTDGSSFVVQQLAAGGAQFGVATAEPALLGYSRNENFTSVYELLTTNVFDTWVLEDSPVQSFNDLGKGTKLAVEDLAGGEIPGLNVRFKGMGLEPGTDVEFVQFGDSTALAADMLAKKQVNAMTIDWLNKIGVALALERSGVKLRCITCSSAEALASESIFVNNEFLEQNRELVEGHGRALAKASVFGYANPDAVMAIMKKVNPEEQVDAEFAKAYLAAALDIMRPWEGQQPGWHNKDAWRRTMQTLMVPEAPERLEAEVDIDKMVNNDHVGAYNDFDKAAVEQQAKDYDTGG
jgi:NitT/TauT family transport system substrate-binding protein